MKRSMEAQYSLISVRTASELLEHVLVQTACGLSIPIIWGLRYAMLKYQQNCRVVLSEVSSMALMRMVSPFILMSCLAYCIVIL